MDHADSASIRVGRTSEPHRAIVDNDAARIRVVHALQDAHQRRFACAVPADDGVDGPRRDSQIDLVVGQKRSERAGHTASAEANLDASRVGHLKKSGYPWSTAL